MSKLVVRRLKPSEHRILNQRLSDRTLSVYVLDRYHIIRAILQGFNPTEVSRILGCERMTVYQWVYTYNTTGFSEFEKVTSCIFVKEEDFSNHG
jgi:hypothetical protein